MSPYQVLVVEDDPIAAAAHTAYVQRVPGFAVAGTVGTGQEALTRLARPGVDLVLLDMNLPDLHGLAVCRALRAAGHGVDVIAVTSARDLAVVQAAVSVGVVQYLLKPFVFASLAERLGRYAAYRAELDRGSEVGGQREVDRLLGSLRSAEGHEPPKGLATESVEAVIALLRHADGPLTAAEVGSRVGMSRVGARRYLERLVLEGLVRRSPRFGGLGRPEIEYAWSADDGTRTTCRTP